MSTAHQTSLRPHAPGHGYLLSPVSFTDDPLITQNLPLMSQRILPPAPYPYVQKKTLGPGTTVYATWVRPGRWPPLLLRK